MTQDYIALGFVSLNKELFLFDQHVSMSKPLESWLSETELAMQDSLRKQMVDAIENFTQEPIEEWALDYPQQVTISTIHLILSQEINDILLGMEALTPAPATEKQEGKEGENEDGAAEEKKEEQQKVPNSIQKGFEE